MLKIVKLFTAVLVSMFLAGCGGGGGGSDGGGKSANISFAELEAKFPAFPNVTADKVKVVKGKSYIVADDFDVSIFRDINGYDYDVSRWTDASYVEYFVLLKDGGLYVEISSESNFTALTDETFDAAFGLIKGELEWASISIVYDDDISSKYSDYSKSIKTFNTSYECEDSNYCYREDDNFTYYWEAWDKYYSYNADISGYRK